MKKILITGFEPFGDDSRNPSGEAVRALTVSDEYEVKKLILPVTWQTAFPKIREVWDAWHPDALLMVGLAAGAKTLRIERVGINLCGATKDNDGLYADGSSDSMAEAPVIPGAADGYFATYNERAILDALTAAEIPAKYSYSAGAYICNYLLFSSLEKCRREGSDMKIGFIHLPYAEGQREDGVPAMPLETMIRGLGIAVDHMWE
ncbi:MAG: pyroglutamyl-peptidase I [Clostridia bacterium]|nr:pyroglutamyl-peptidase I [Clostridia bacterium]